MKPTLKLTLWKAVFYLEIQLWVHRAEISACSNTGTKQEMQLNITCDNYLDVYVDGNYIGGNEYPDISKFNINRGSEILAVKCEGNPKYSSSAILASLGNGLVTDSAWKCTSKLELGWNMKNFDDLDWPSAVELETNTQIPMPWGQKLDIAENAKFIWTNDVSNDVVVYCRRPLVTRCSEQRFHFFTTKTEWKDKALMNWVLKRTIVENIRECGMNCLNTPQCVSFNVEYTEKTQRTCELNREKNGCSPSYRKGLQYFEIVKAGY